MPTLQELCRGNVSDQLSAAEKKLIDVLEEERGKCRQTLVDQVGATSLQLCLLYYQR